MVIQAFQNQIRLGLDYTQSGCMCVCEFVNINLNHFYLHTIPKINDKFVVHSQRSMLILLTMFGVYSNIHMQTRIYPLLMNRCTALDTIQFRFHSYAVQNIYITNSSASSHPVTVSSSR